jgi:hypothetical protein
MGQSNSKGKIAAEGIDETLILVDLVKHHPSKSSGSGYAMAYKIGE